MRRSLAVPIILALAFLAAPVGGAPLFDGGSSVFLPYVSAPPPTPTPTITPTPTETATPTVTPTPTATREPDALEWDPRLDQRGVGITPAAPQPGQGYWRLVKGVWYAENEPPMAGQHHIFVDTLREDGSRRPGVRLDVTSPDGMQLIGTMLTELKPGELYAANFPMWKDGKYRTLPADGNPADAVSNLSMGSIELPDWAIHTSYGFVWQWTVAPAATATPTETATPAPTETSVMEGVRR